MALNPTHDPTHDPTHEESNMDSIGNTAMLVFMGACALGLIWIVSSVRMEDWMLVLSWMTEVALEALAAMILLGAVLWLTFRKLGWFEGPKSQLRWLGDIDDLMEERSLEEDVKSVWVKLYTIMYKEEGVRSILSVVGCFLIAAVVAAAFAKFVVFRYLLDLSRGFGIGEGGWWFGF